MKQREVLIYLLSLGVMETLTVSDYEGGWRSKCYRAVEVFMTTPFTVTPDFQADQMLSISAETPEFISTSHKRM